MWLFSKIYGLMKVYFCIKKFLNVKRLYLCRSINNFIFFKNVKPILILGSSVNIFTIESVQSYNKFHSIKMGRTVPTPSANHNFVQNKSQRKQLNCFSINFILFPKKLYYRYWFNISLTNWPTSHYKAIATISTTPDCLFRKWELTFCRSLQAIFNKIFLPITFEALSWFLSQSFSFLSLFALYFGQLFAHVPWFCIIRVPCPKGNRNPITEAPRFIRLSVRLFLGFMSRIVIVKQLNCHYYPILLYLKIGWFLSV